MLNKKLFKLVKKRKTFLSKLYDILDNTTYKEIIYWNKEGKGIIIAKINEFSTMILPKYFRSSTYSSFVRQLNLYGYHKIQGLIEEGEGYEHDKLNKNSTMEDFQEILKLKKRRNLLMKYLNKYSKDNFKNIFKRNNYDDEENILKFLLEQNEKNMKIINQSKKEIEKLERQNRKFYNELQLYKNGNNIILKNIMKNILNNIIKEKKTENRKI
jgi:hypothetical protein